MSFFPFYRQLNHMDCGPTCLRMIAKYYGRHYNTEGIREYAGYSKVGVSLLGISEAAENIGFNVRGVQMTYEQLVKEADLPCILHWDQQHYVVLISTFSWFRTLQRIRIADPSKGIVTYTPGTFLQHWISGADEDGKEIGIALLLKPGKAFFDKKGEIEHRLGWKAIIKYLNKSWWRVIQIFITLVATSLLQLIFPFLTKSIVDTGINTKNIRFITIILMAQAMLVISKAFADFIRNRLLLRISFLLNFSILSGFWLKLTRLPLSYFDRHQTGDTLQRITDNKLIQNFITGNAINTLFSLFNFFIYSIVLAMFNIKLFLIFMLGGILYFFWITYFLQIRRKINYETFHLASKENAITLQLIQGMQEIRLHNAGDQKRNEWEKIQAGIFRLNFRALTYNQIQQAGAVLINEGKDIVITFMVASLVIENKLTLGAMLAIQYIIGQLSGPIEMFVGFIQNAQDVQISIERLNDIHQLQDEEEMGLQYLNKLPVKKTIRLNKISFTYPGVGNKKALENIDLEIPEGKVTAIVGVSGSGKTTLLKLLLKIYNHYSGEILVGETDFRQISPSFWRDRCGVVLQDSYIFDDSIAQNIAVGIENPDHAKLIKCCKIANILSFIESLPNKFNTRLGANGIGISQGQKQRLLIARAIYKDPEYLLLDESTNALDANSESVIIRNLNAFFKGRTVIIVAHRLSTVQNADKIIVLNQGLIVEQGSHRELSHQKGRYYELIKNQLELGN
jgi:ATP-binding cassette, subfamily B, bacterial